MLRREDVDRRRAEGSHRAVATHPGAAAAAMLIFMLSLGGIPPTAGFMGKLWLFGAAIDAGYVGLAVIGVAEQRAVALLLPARRRVHVVARARGRGPGAQHLAGAWRRVDRRCCGHDRVRRLSSAAVRGRPGVGVDARRRAGTRATIANGRSVITEEPVGLHGRQLPDDWRAEHRRPLVRLRHSHRVRLRVYLDTWLGTGPWLLLIFTVFGLVAGITNVYRTAGRFLK